MHIDLGEPHCFACGTYDERWDRPQTSQDRWNRAELERAHIVPGALGGSDDASNVILLCKQCHRESPDWIDSTAMAAWIATRKPRGEIHMELWTDAFAQVPETAELARLCDDHGFDAIRPYMRKAFDWATSHFGVGLSPGTRVAILRKAVELANEAYT
jgi:hypothetical protein